MEGKRTSGKTLVEMERHYQERHESLEHQGGIGH